MIDQLLRRLLAPAPAPLPRPEGQLALAALLVRVARADGSYQRMLARITRVAVLVLDDFSTSRSKVRRSPAPGGVYNA